MQWRRRAAADIHNERIAIQRNIQRLTHPPVQAEALAEIAHEDHTGTARLSKPLERIIHGGSRLGRIQIASPMNLSALQCGFTRLGARDGAPKQRNRWGLSPIICKGFHLYLVIGGRPQRPRATANRCAARFQTIL